MGAFPAHPCLDASICNSYTTARVLLSKLYVFGGRYSREREAITGVLLTEIKVLLRNAPSTSRLKRIARSLHMLDIILLAGGLVFFALSVGYAVACDRL
jgi:hypothetical protein